MTTGATFFPDRPAGWWGEQKEPTPGFAEKVRNASPAEFYALNLEMSRLRSAKFEQRSADLDILLAEAERRGL
jgi:hypothetical protein